MRMPPFFATALAAALAASSASAQTRTGDAPAANSAASAAPPAAPAVDATTTDIRCIVVAGALAQYPDPELQKLGGVSLIYFWGRLEGRGETGNIDARVSEVAAKMTADDFQAQARTCGAMVSAAGQDLQSLGEAVKARIGGAAPGH